MSNDHVLIPVYSKAILAKSQYQVTVEPNPDLHSPQQRGEQVMGTDTTHGIGIFKCTGSFPMATPNIYSIRDQM